MNEPEHSILYECQKKTQISLCICMFLLEPSLNSVSSQCARDKSSIARKPKVQSKIFKWLITFQKCNPPDFNFHPGKLTDKKFHHIDWC